MKKKRYLRVFSFMLTGFLIAVTTIAGFRHFKKKKQQTAYSGIELFKGIFFNEGNAYQAILDDNNTRQAKVADPKLHLIQKQLLTRLSAQDVHFFDNFKSDIQSGNPVIIESRLLKSREVVGRQLNKIREEELHANSVINSTSVGAAIAPYPGTNPNVVVVTPPPVNYVALIKSSNTNNVPDLRAHSLETEALVFAIAENLKTGSNN